MCARSIGRTCAGLTQHTMIDCECADTALVSPPCETCVANKQASLCGARTSDASLATMQSFKNYLHAVREGDSKPARTTIKGLSVFTGGFLIIAGFFGLSMIIQGDLLYVVGSIYAIIFGLLVLVVEIKDRTPIITRAYQWIDTYLKFLTLQVRALQRER